MALQLGALRDALIDAGAKPEIAGKAAEELAAYDDQFESLERIMLNKFAEAERSTLNKFAEAERFTLNKFAEAERSTSERFAALDTRIARLEERMEGRFGQIDERFQRAYWMLGVVIVLLAGVLGRLLFIH